METLLIGAIAGLGYYLNKEKRVKNNELQNDNIVSPNELSSSDNIYSSRHLDKVQEKVFKKATQNYKDAEKPMKTGIVNGDTLLINKKNYYKDKSIVQSEKDINKNNKISTTRFPSSSSSVIDNSFSLLNENDVEQFGILKKNMTQNTMQYNTPSFSNNGQKGFKTIKNSIYGKGVNVYEGHSNMEPFFGSSVKQNLNENANETKLGHFTGSDVAFRHKKESKMLFKPVKQNIYGQNSIKRDTSRYVASMYTKTNQLPFEQIRVGPGLNSDADKLTTNIGFHDSYRPKQKNVDDLRVNPKETYKGRIAGEKHFVGLRGKSSVVNVNRQSGSLSHINRKQLPNKGAVSASTILNKDAIVLKHVERNKYAAAIAKFKGPKRGDNAQTMPFSDKARYNIKQETQYHTHSHTNTKSLINNPVVNPYDIAKNTIKQETEYHQHSHINLGGPEHAHKMSLNDKARNTIKQQTLSSYSGNKEGFTAHKSSLNDEAKTTIRQQTSREYSGVKGSSESGQQSSRLNFYNAEINALKEQTIKRREPVSQGAKSGPSKKQYNNVLRKNQLNTYSFTKHYNPTAPGPTNKYNNGVFTRQKQVYGDRQFNNDRINPLFVEAFKKNPYTQSLHSYQNVHNPKSINR
jgi:hypothetical protein